MQPIQPKHLKPSISAPHMQIAEKIAKLPGNSTSHPFFVLPQFDYCTFGAYRLPSACKLIDSPFSAVVESTGPVQNNTACTRASHAASVPPAVRVEQQKCLPTAGF